MFHKTKIALAAALVASISLTSFSVNGAFAADPLYERVCGSIRPAPAIAQKNIGAAARPHRLKKHPAARPSGAKAPLAQPCQTTQAASATSVHSLEDRSINLPPSASNSVARS